MLAGRIADRVGKPQVIRATKIWEFIVIGAAVFSLHMRNIPLMMGTLFVLSMQATFFSPAKYGVLPELVPVTELPWANAWINVGTFMGILAGTLAAGYLAGNLTYAKAFLVVAGVIGLVAAFQMRALPAAKPDERISLNLFRDLTENWRLVRQDPLLTRGVIAVNYFWFVGAAVQLNLVLYGAQMLQITPGRTTWLIMAMALGIGLGSFLCGKLSKHHIALGWVPVGAAIMTVFGFYLMFAYHSLYHAAFAFFMVGLGGGFYDIPLMALIQARSPGPDRGRVLATVNFLSFVAILAATVVLWVLGSLAGLNPAQIFGVLSGFSLVSTWGVWRYVR
jgi:acyl-[acyl-carrier-protein]-phospholipid O-acyltransferase/long-chain-fatty-acid--[acyl-carrier-protein] ligase